MSLRNLLPALLEYAENRFVSKALQQIGDDNEANYLREEELGVPAKELSSITHSVAEICSQEYRIHKLKVSRGYKRIHVESPLSGLGKGRRRRSLPSMRSRELRAQARV